MTDSPTFVSFAERVGAKSDDSTGLLDKIKTHINNQTGYWKTYPITLPKSEVLDDQNTSILSPGIFDVNILDEPEDDPFSSTTSRLGSTQLSEIQQTATITIESKAYPGKFHVWKLNRLAQKGFMFIQETFFNRMAFFVELWIITIFRFWFGLKKRDFSIPNGIKRVWRTVYDLTDLLIGLGRRTPKYFEPAISNIRAEHRSKAVFEGFEPVLTGATFSNNYFFSIFQSSDMTIDNRILNLPQFRKKLLSVAEITQAQWLQAESAFVDLIRLGSDGTLTDEIISEKSVAEQKRLFFIEVEKHLEPSMFDFVKQYVTAFDLYYDLEKKYLEARTSYKKSIESELRTNHSIRSLIPEWIESQVKKSIKAFDRDHLFEFEKELSQILTNNGLTFFAQMVTRHLEFVKTTWVKIQSDLEKETVSKYTFEFNRRIWNPNHWVKSEQNNRWKIDSKSESYTTNTGHVAWRIWLLLNKTWVDFSNVNFYLIAVMLLNGPFSVKALFYRNKYIPDKTIDSATGEIIPDPASELNTFCSRIVNLWTNVRASREKFTSAPDTGILSKRISNIFNVIWNYLICGVLGTVLLVLIHPLLCVLNIILMILLSVMSPIYIPLWSIVYYLGCVLIYDPYYYGEYGSCVVCPFLVVLIGDFVWGLIQILGSIVGTIVLAIFSVLVILFAVFEWLITVGWDAFFRTCFLRPLGRIPKTENFLARRISGPGVSRNYLQQVSTSQALVLIQAYMEKMELDYFESDHRDKIREPQMIAQQTYAMLFDEFILSGRYNLSDKITRSTDAHLHTLSEIVQKQRKLYATYSIRNKDIVRMSKADLDQLVELVPILIKQFCEGRNIFRYISLEAFFKGYNIAVGDWVNLSKHIIMTVFSPNIMTPIENETNESFRLEIEHVGFRQFMSKLIETGEPHADLDTVKVIVPSKRVTIRPIFMVESMLHNIFEVQASHILNVKYYMSDKRNKEIVDAFKQTDESHLQEIVTI
jgi:hypothetical protein